MKTALFIIECWAAVSFTVGPIWLALIHTHRTGFHVRRRR